MAKFIYIARDKNGQKIKNIEEAASQEELIARLQAREMIVISIMLDIGNEENRGASQEILGKARLKIRHFKVTTEDLALFCRQLSTLLSAGVTILKSLDIISKQVSSRRLYNCVLDLQRKMENGLSLHESMGKHPDIFSELWVNLVESGEASGNLSVVLSRLASYLERSAAFKSKIISALIYPMILFCAGLGALLFLTIKIIPSFAELFRGFNIDLPFLTKVLISVSDFLKTYWWMILGGLVVGSYLLKNYLKTKEGRREYERFVFNLPMLGDFYRAVIVERFSSGMSTLIESGVPILYSLEISEKSVGNLTVSDIIKKVKEDVRVGKPLSQPLDKSGFFDPMVVQMITIGEEIGELASMFKKINVFYQELVETFLTRLASMFEPIILLFIGGVIGLMIVGMFLPIFKISQLGGG